MIEIAIGGSDVSALRAALLGDDDVEQCAIAYASETTKRGDPRLIVREIELPTPADYLVQKYDAAVLSPDFVAKISKRARLSGLSLIFSHSHPGSSAPDFSPADDGGEVHLSKFLAFRNPGRTHAALVASRGGMRARSIGGVHGAKVVELAGERKVLFDPNDAAAGDDKLFDRQVRAFGSRGQRALSQLSVGIVGLGGTGSLVAQQLSHLGVRNFILIDPDVVEASNLNRVVGASREDLGRPKVAVAENVIRAVSADSSVRSISGDVVHARVAGALTECDIIFGCTDSHGSRAVLQQVAYQYLIPCIDVGSTITTSHGRVSGIYGRVQMLAPGHACLTCSGLLNAEEVRRDMMSSVERKTDRYITGAREPAPSVISLNGTVVSLGVTMLLSYVTGIPSSARYLLYDAVKSTLRSVRATPTDNCYICSREGTYARGDAIPLYARQD